MFNFYLEADIDTINDSLKKDIKNPDEYDKKKKQIVFLAKATANKKHNEYLFELAHKFQEAVLLNIEKPIAVLKQLMLGNPSFALYKNSLIGNNVKVGPGYRIVSRILPDDSQVM